jgi:hypothetical protein
MKFLWSIVTLLLLAGLIVLLQPPSEPEQKRLIDEALRADAARSVEVPREPTVAEAANPEPATTPTSTSASASASAPAPAPTSEPVGASAAAAAPAQAPTQTPPTKPRPEDEPSAEPPPPDPSVLASGSNFTPEIPQIPDAEILPSSFIRLPDGSISVDDAWTIRGAGTAESPYEVSWEFLSSAQESYIPRLAENKIPARIAFLSGKRVRIAGYIAFPLVTQSADECLLMLNQWDGCCIGIPPTPYDAVEVRLAQSVSGWKRHSINFGAIEGTMKVEPYLVENWLVGLYLMEDARIDRDI